MKFNWKDLNRFLSAANSLGSNLQIVRQRRGHALILTKDSEGVSSVHAEGDYNEIAGCLLSTISSAAENLLSSIESK